MTQEEHNFLAGIYRNQERISELLTMIGSVLQRATGVSPFSKPQPEQKPVQADLPGIGHILNDDWKHSGAAPQDTADLPSGLCWVNEPGVAYKPGDIAKEIAKKPRTWCNTVKVWEWLADKYTVFSLCDMARDVGEISRITNGRICAASYSRIISTLKRAGAILKTTRNTYMPLKPTDELREAVERVAKKRKEVAA